MNDDSEAVIAAAGAVVWRTSRKHAPDIEIALIHRARYDDWSFPKGKLEKGETAILAAVREVREETGLTVRLGRRLAQIRYPLPAQDKIKQVDYWVAEAIGGTFGANSEVDELRWVTPAAAADLLTYDDDRQLLEWFGALPPDTGTLLIVRHARAGKKAQWDGDDTQRPLDKLGLEQADALAGQLLAFGATHVHSADRLRCTQTVDPLAAFLGADIEIEPTLAEEAYRTDPAPGRDRSRKIASESGIRVICSQGKVIPDLVRWWADSDGIELPETATRKGSTWVLSLVGGCVVAADYIDSPLPPENSGADD